MGSIDIINKFLSEGVYSNKKKTITIEETEIEVIDFENFQIGETYLKRTYSYDEKGNQTVTDETNYIAQKTQRQKYDFLKNLMLDFAGELSKNPAEAFAVKADVEDLKFWAELGAAEAVIAKLESIENNTTFTDEVKAYLIGKIQNFLA